jgi:hypothetical protein
MKYILIDTNCLVDILVQETEEKSLRSLEYWVNGGKITLMVPPRLQEEWVRNKNRVFNELRQGINQGLNAFQKRLQRDLKGELKRLEKKAERIDSLLVKGKSCPPNRAVHGEVGIRRTEKLPPYHISENSDGDAYIYFSGMDFIKKRRIKELVFLSHDKKAFSHPNNENELHPQLQVSGINIFYAYGIGPGTRMLREMLGGRDDEKGEENADYESIFYVFDNDKKRTVAEQLCLAMDAYHDQMPMIPTHLLAKVFPFKIPNGQKNYTYHSAFQINTNNRSLIELLKSVDITKDGKITLQKPELVKKLRGSQKMLETTLRRLNYNLIHSLSLISDNLDVNINLGNRKGETIEELFNNFDFAGALELLQKKPQKMARDTLRHAYFNFHFGDFDAAMQLFDSVYEKSLAEEKPLLQFISLYNMKRLKTFISSYYTTTDQRTQEIMRKVDKLSIRKYWLSVNTDVSFVQECMAWIAETDFYHEAFINLSETVGKIRDHYNLQLTGGYSSNSNYIVLVSQFAEIDQFLEQNCIIFNTYSNFEQVIEKLVEGLLMMYTFNKRQPVYLDELDEILLERMIMFAKRETLIKYYKRLRLRTVAITEEKKGTITKKAERFFAGYNELQDKLAKTEEKPVYFFWEKYYKVAANLLLVLTIAESDDDLTGIAKSLIDIFKGEKSRRRLEPDHIADLIREKGKFIQTAVLKDFLKLTLDNDLLHSTVVFEAFRKQKAKNHKSLSISNEKLLKKVEQNFFQKCPKCDSYHEPALLREVAGLLSEPLRKKLLSKIIQKLEKEFDPQLYYIFAIYGDIDYRLFFERFLSTCPPLKAPSQSQQYLASSEATYYRLNELINLAFAWDIPTSSRSFERYKGMSKYYDWLLNIDDFDYNEFDPEWILAYKTEVYFKRIFSSPNLLTYMASYLKKTKHPFLSQLMIEYGFGGT